MISNFQICLAETLKWEGGWSDHPRDPGGATMKGVTLATYRAYKRRAVTKTELRAIPNSDLQSIYRTEYWNRASCDGLAAGVDAVAFDVAVNSGPERARQWLGQIADIDPTRRVKKLCARRLAFFRSLSTFDVFGKGWTRRCNAIEAFALRLAGATRGEIRGEARRAGAASKTQAAGAAVSAGAPAGATGHQPTADAISSGLPGWAIAVIVIVAFIAAAALAWRAWQNNQRRTALLEAVGG